MSDRRAWLDEWCPECRAAPGTRCRDRHRYSCRARCGPAPGLHVARGWRTRRCPTCKAFSGDACHTPSGRQASQPHTARLRPARGELVARQAVWEELARVGYGRPRGRRPRPDRAYGRRRAQRLDGLVGKFPRALAKRLPTSADTHRSGANDGHDIYGPVSCSQTLRSGHLGILAAAGGLWHSRNPGASPYAETTAGDLPHDKLAALDSHRRTPGATV
jgi:hypothetical protein